MQFLFSRLRSKHMTPRSESLTATLRNSRQAVRRAALVIIRQNSSFFPEFLRNPRARADFLDQFAAERWLLFKV
jgi:hypothetical protein